MSVRHIWAYLGGCLPKLALAWLEDTGLKYTRSIHRFLNDGRGSSDLQKKKLNKRSGNYAILTASGFVVLLTLVFVSCYKSIATSQITLAGDDSLAPLSVSLRILSLL